ncbi:MAG TPA: long-chain fatty acid--CoA ligase [Bacillota bacterium]
MDVWVGDWSARGAAWWPDRPAVVDVGRGDGGRFTFADLDRRAGRLAAWLRDEAGVGRGDRVALLARNGVEYLDAFYACCKLGAIFVPFNWRLHPRELADLAARIGPRVILASREFEAGAAAMGDAAGQGATRLDLGALYEDALTRDPRRPVEPADLAAEDIACLLFTGGTTGLPKAARISYRMIAWNILNTVIHELNRDDVTITHTPMFHTGGLLVYTIPLLTLGGRVVIMQRWDPDQMLELVERERVTLFFCVPAQFRMLMDSPRFARTDFSSVRFVTSGGAPLPPALVAAWRAVHDMPFKQGFGMTEFGPGVFSMSPEEAARKPGSIGRPNYFVDARVVDEDGRPLPPGQVGELVLRGPSLCSGYWGAGSDPRDAAGWFHTGDLARVDEEGFYYIVDRKKDMFISGGENVYPAEIEEVLTRHPDVAQCAVVGVPDERWGDVGVAFVVPAAGARPDAEMLKSFVADHLARYKVPKRVLLVDGLPLSPAGKVLKDVLRQQAMSDPGGPPIGERGEETA